MITAGVLANHAISWHCAVRHPIIGKLSSGVPGWQSGCRGASGQPPPTVGTLTGPTLAGRGRKGVFIVTAARPSGGRPGRSGDIGEPQRERRAKWCSAGVGDALALCGNHLHARRARSLELIVKSTLRTRPLT